MFVDRSNSQLQALKNTLGQGSQAQGFGAFSFSSAIFSSTALSGLNNAFGRDPQNPVLQALGSVFQSISMVTSFEGYFGHGCCCQPPPPPPCPPQTQQGQMWDVFFDAKSGTKTTQQSPIVLDLNGNGKADITGSNIKGNGKLEGTTVKGFDLNQQDRQWETKSVNRRPGKDAPALGADVGAQVFDKDGKLVKTLTPAQVKQLQKNDKTWHADGKDMGLGLGKGMRAEFRDGNGRLVGELKSDGTQKNEGKLLFFWGNKNENEWTKAWDAKTGGDGMLVWDTDGDGKITSGKELFGHVDLNGKNTFKNGYEKLSHYFDKDKDGTVQGSELKGLKIWEDRNGDGITQKGELVELAQHGISKLNTQFNEQDMSSSYSFRKPGQATEVAQPAPGRLDYQGAMQQTWQIFQMIEVMRQMQAWGGPGAFHV
jgi:hypothetical protein